MADAPERRGGAAPEGSEPSDTAPQARGKQSQFINKIAVNLFPKSRAGWAVAIIIFAVLIISWLTNFLSFRTALRLFGVTYGVTLIGAVTVLVIVGFILYGWLKDESDTRNANRFIATALAIWLLDLVPQNLATFLWLSRLGPSYAGFEFPLSLGVLKLSIVSVILSSFFFALLYLQMVFNIVKKEWLVFTSMFGLIVIINYTVNLFYPNSANFNFIVPGGKVAYVVVIIGILVLGYLAWRYDKEKKGTAFGELVSSVYMTVVYSFFVLNNGWQGNLRAIIHAAYILWFGYFYIKAKKNDDPVTWRLYIPSLLLIDFFGYGLLWNSGLLVLRFIPPVVLVTIFYCYHQETKEGNEKYTYPVTAFILLATFILIMSVDKVAGFEGGTFQFTPKQGNSYKDLYGQFTNQLRDFVEGRLDIATAGLYRGAVERNRYESLGVYFSNVRAADPKFYTNEPIIIWGAIRSKTYQDAVLINFKCYRLKDNKPIYSDKTVPEQVFPIFTLEEADTECVFNPKAKKNEKIQAGPNTLTMSAEYNFATDAYLKTYFIDRERFRAYARNNIDPLSESGIKDKNPVPVFTNGPVEIGMSTGQPLVTISDTSLVIPSIGITLTNRQEIQDKDKRVITRWDGKIKNIIELVLLVPPGIELPDIDKCAKPENDEERLKCPCSMPFKAYSSGDCITTCNDEQTKQTCYNVCDSSFKTSDEDGQKKCKKDCDDSRGNCVEECNFLFDTKGEGFTGKYAGYALDVSSPKFKDLNKDIDNIDRHRSFQCRFKATDKEKLLDKTPITTRYFRVRAKYNYLLENSVIVNVEEPPKGTLQSSPDSVCKIASEFNQGASEASKPELISAIAWVESQWRHCCKEPGKTSAGSCAESGKKDCTPDTILKSYDDSSIGIMQIQYYVPIRPGDTPEKIKQKELKQKKIQDEVTTLAQDNCRTDESGRKQTVFDYECNEKIGKVLLQQKLDRYGANGCQTGNCKTCESSISHKKYSEYRGIEAALRGYNGFGCASGADTGYVERVLDSTKKMDKCIVIDNSISEISSPKEGSATFEDTTDQTSAPSSQPPTNPLDPEITSIEPAKIIQNRDAIITIRGQKFQQGSEINFVGPEKVDGNLQYDSETQLSFKSAFTTVLGPYYVSIKNPDGRQSNRFTVEIVSSTAQTQAPYTRASYDDINKVVRVSWNKIKTEESYAEVLRSREGDSGELYICTDLHADSGEQYNCIDGKPFIPGTKYTYNIHTYTDTKELLPIRTVDVNIPSTPTGPPYAEANYFSIDDLVIISWKKLINDEKKYEVVRYSGGKIDISVCSMDSTSNEKYGCTDKFNLVPGKKYVYHIAVSYNTNRPPSEILTNEVEVSQPPE